MAEIVLVPIDNIIVGKRHRQDLGDIEALAGSINTLGLLQPIGVDSQMNLVFGQRRLEACRSLEWENISARVIDVPSLLAERDENEVRKNFTISERVAIGLAVEKLLGDRRGQRTDIADSEHVVNCPHVEPGQKTREVAAREAGFENETVFRRARHVTEHGTPELVSAMDKGDVSVSAASVLARLPQEEQQSVLAGGKEAILDRVRQSREMQSDKGVEESTPPSVPAQVEAHSRTPVCASSVPPSMAVSASIPVFASAPAPEPAPAPAFVAVPEQTRSGEQVARASFSGNNEWFTPAKWIELARQAMDSIDVDPASNAMAQQTVQAAQWYDQERNGLQQEWQGNVWLNPPYARGLIDEFIDKLVAQFQSGITKQAVVLVDNRTDTRWFHVLCSAASAVAFTKGRVNFYNETVESSSPTNGSVFVYLGSCVQAFKQAFDSNCLVLFTQEALFLQESHHGP
ncbi:MAG: ParB N-terminal domain-containing protein [Magnetococcales bacterium]|nr:ParB N-terminal domain-containing protein [Magnetococcales bacterium]